MTDVAKQAATSTSTIEGAMGNLEAAVVGGLTDAFNLFKPAVTGGINAASTAVTSLATTGVQGLQTFFGQVKDTGAFTALQSARAVGRRRTPIIVERHHGGRECDDRRTAGGNRVRQRAQHRRHGRADGRRLAEDRRRLDQSKHGSRDPPRGRDRRSVAAVTAVTTAMRIAAVAQALLNAVMAANPIMLVITLIAALVAGLTYFFTCTNTGKAVWSSFTGFLSGCVQGIIGFFSGLGSTIIGIFSSAANGARNAWNGVVGWFRGLPGSIAGFFGNAGSILYNAGASIISGFLNGLKSMWSNVTGWISGIGDWIKPTRARSATTVACSSPPARPS